MPLGLLLLLLLLLLLTLPTPPPPPLPLGAPKDDRMENREGDDAATAAAALPDALEPMVEREGLLPSEKLRSREVAIEGRTRLLSLAASAAETCERRDVLDIDGDDDDDPGECGDEGRPLPDEDDDDDEDEDDEEDERPFSRSSRWMATAPRMGCP